MMFAKNDALQDAWVHLSLADAIAIVAPVEDKKAATVASDCMV